MPGMRHPLARSPFAFRGLRQTIDSLKKRGRIKVRRWTAHGGMEAAPVARAVRVAVVLSAESWPAACLAFGGDIGAGTVQDAVGIVSEAEAFAGKGAAGTRVSSAHGRGAEARHQDSSGMEKARSRRALSVNFTLKFRISDSDRFPLRDVGVEATWNQRGHESKG